MRRVCSVVSGLTLILAAGHALGADNVAAGRVLEFKSGAVDTTVGVNLLHGAKALARGVPYVIQLDGPMTPAKQAALTRAGITLHGYIPAHAYIARLDGVAPAEVAKLGFVVWLGEFRREWKIDPELGRRMLTSLERRVLAAQGQARIVIETFAGEGPEQVLAHLKQIGGTLISHDPCGPHWLIEATLPAALAPALADLSSVQFIEDAMEIELRNDSTRWIIQSNVSTQTPVWDRGITGQGQIAGIIDSAVRESHCAFDDAVAAGPTHRKIVAFRGSTGSSSHGTHCAGTIVGDNLPHGQYTQHDGMAFSAKLTATNSSSVTSTNLLTYLMAAHGDGARCHSNSWGNDSTTAYTTHCQQIDQFTWAEEDNMVAFAVTNTSSLKTPENSVNVFAVGASGDTPSQGNHCSGGAGPTSDGRRKPEIYAPGCGTTSASSSTTCGTSNLTGTSMACPAITGAAILVRQYFTDGFYPSGAATAGDARIPTGALIKAVMLNGTVDMTGPAGYPSNQEGFGRLLLDNALFFPGDARKLHIVDVRNAQGLSTGASASFPVNVASSGQPLRISMVFSAPPATVNTSNPVINDLNLEVIGPGGTYLGNVFSAGQSAPGGTADAKNNAELVILNAPAPGTYTITIRGAAVNQGTQGYAVAVTGDLTSGCTGASISSTLSNQSVQTGQSVSFSISAAGSGTLQYQWRRNTQNLIDDGRITGATTASLTINSAILGDAGSYDVVVSNACGTDTSNAATLGVSCYANCDGSTGSPLLTSNDFQCFLNKFAAGDAYANCDGSTGVPTLTSNDFQCFLNKFASGCP